MPEDRPLSNFNRHPMLWLGVCFAFGVFAAKFVPPGGMLLPVVSSLAFAAIAFFSRKYGISTLFIAAAFVLAGAVSFQSEAERINAPGRLRVLYDNGTIRSGDPVEIEGVLAALPEPSSEGVVLNLKTDKIAYRASERRASGIVRLFLRHADQTTRENDLKFEISDLKYGSRIRVACDLKREDEFLNPGVIPRKEMLDRLGIDATGSIKSPMLIERIADESVFLPLAWVFAQRTRLIEDFSGNLSRPAAGVMIASLLGDKNFLDKNTADVFREGGTFHILVISGLHITFIGGILLLFVRQFTQKRWLQFAATTTVLWAYTFAVGADVPVVRAAIMFTVVSYSYVIYRKASLLNALGICCLILLVWRPSDLFGPSFQLTFVSVAAIVAMSFPLIEILRKIGRWTPTNETPFPPNVPQWFRHFCEMLYWREAAWKFELNRQIWTANIFKSPFLRHWIKGGFQSATRDLFEGILVSLVVQLWMLPLVVVYFHRVSVASVLLNIWVGCFIAIESFAAVIGAIIGHFSGNLAAGFFAFAEVCNWVMLALPMFFAENGWASFRLPAYSGNCRAIYFLYFLPFLFLAIAVDHWNPFAIKQRDRLMRRNVLMPVVSTLFLLLSVIVFHPFSSPRPDGRLHINFLDVGQGDAALVTFPDGQTLLVDGGGRIRYRKDHEDAEMFEPDMLGIGEAVVSEFLWNRGYARIDHILATHPDADHTQGLGDVAKNFGVRSAMFGRLPPNDPEFAALAEILRRRAIPLDDIGRGDVLSFGGATIEVLNPLFSDDANTVSDNDHSVVLRIIYGSRAILLTGDIERAAETFLLDSGGSLRADVIKVAHHGSRTSSTAEFIDAVGAKYAVISVGRSSPFGHPHTEVVERWRAPGAILMTTGIRGTISVSTDGKDLEIKTFVHDGE